MNFGRVNESESRDNVSTPSGLQQFSFWFLQQSEFGRCELAKDLNQCGQSHEICIPFDGIHILFRFQYVATPFPLIVMLTSWAAEHHICWRVIEPDMHRF